jgi:signal transduction histidine kinase
MVMEVMNHKNRLSMGKGLALILLLNGLFVAYLLVRPGSRQTLTFVDNLTQLLLEVVGLLFALPLCLPWKGQNALLLPESAVKTRSQRWVPLLLGLGILSYIIGQGIWTYNEDIAHLTVLFPTWADAGYLGSYPLVLLAILLLPRRPLPLHTRVRVLLDGLIIMMAIVTFSWYFVLGPTLMQGATTVTAQIIGTVYPLGALVLVFCLLLLTRNHDPEMQPVLLLLSFALITIVITDSIYDYLELHNLYTTGGLLDVGWPLGYMLLGLSAHMMQRRATSRQSSTSALPPLVANGEKSEDVGLPSSLSQAVLLSLTVCAVVVLRIWILLVKVNPILAMGMSLGATILLALMVVRQILVVQEAIRQNHLLQRTQQDLSARNEALKQANIQLEEQIQIERAYEQQRRLNEMKDEFIINVSHEFRTPLTQLYGYLELLETYHSTLSDEMQLEFIHKATQGCEALLPLLNSILDVAGKEAQMTPPKVQEIVLANLVREVLNEFEPVQQQERPIHLEIAEGLVVQADRQAVSQVLRNLLSNAFKYSPRQSPVRVVATPCGRAVQSPESTPEVRISVQDKGPGIPREDIPLLFGKFVRLKRDLAGSIPGTGLGLYISKQLVEAMGGKIGVESAGIAGQGSCFYLTLPAPSHNQARSNSQEFVDSGL